MKLIVTGAILFLLTISFVNADVVIGELGIGAQPGDQDPQICIYHRQVRIDGITDCNYRTSLYAFAGEMIEFTIVIRDPNGALDIGFPKIRVASAPEVLCNEYDLPQSCDGMGDMNEETDRAYHCLLTVEPQWDGEKEVKITAYNSAFEPTDGTHVETWFFNPALSMSVSTSDGQGIHFEEMPYGADTPPERTVHSLNRLKVKNTAEGGVNMWMYLAGTDLYDPNGASKCPTTNVLTIDNMQYRGWSGTQWTSWEGWEYMSKYDQNDPCEVFGTCYGGKPVPYPNTGDTIPDTLEYVLTNQGTLEVEFKLTYPMPCIGTFSQGSILVFGKDTCFIPTTQPTTTTTTSSTTTTIPTTTTTMTSTTSTSTTTSSTTTSSSTTTTTQPTTTTTTSSTTTTIPTTTTTMTSTTSTSTTTSSTTTSSSTTTTTQPTTTTTTLPTVYLYLDPSTKTYNVNEIFTIDIVINSVSQDVHAVDARLDFDPNYLEVVDGLGNPTNQILPGTSLPFVLANIVSNTKGTIDYGAGAPLGGSPPSGTFDIATIIFKAKANTAGTPVTFNFTFPRQTIVAYAGYSLPISHVDGNYVIIVQ